MLGITHNTRVRQATQEDIPRLAEIDLLMFENAYGIDTPSVGEVEDMLSRRLDNVSGFAGRMMVCEVAGVPQAFATYFRTNKPWDAFTTWEETTNNGTLEGVVEPEGRYGYVANMTVSPDGSAERAMQRVMAKLFSEAIRDGLEYGYFVSRIPQFTSWLSNLGYDYSSMEQGELDMLAEKYIGITEPRKKGKLESIDYELRTYDRSGFERGVLVKGGFSDRESLNYGVTYKVPVPMYGKPQLLQSVAAYALEGVSKSKKLAGALF